jgi:hypothetical protein
MIILLVIIVFLISIFLVSFKKLNESFGIGVDKYRLNYTLKNLVHILNKHNINEWFIGYGTLLGIIRENSCIDGDDDIDIIINKEDTNKIIELFKYYSYDVKYYKSGKFYKVKNYNYNYNFLRLDKKNHAPIDFYLSEKIGKSYIDKHENILWENCEKLLKYNWSNVIINLPRNPEEKLKKIYGDDWKIPKKKYKGIINNYNNKNPVLI